MFFNFRKNKIPFLGYTFRKKRLSLLLLLEKSVEDLPSSFRIDLDILSSRFKSAAVFSLIAPTFRLYGVAGGEMMKFFRTI